MIGAGRCVWCNKPFRLKKVGAHVKKFCSPACRIAFHSAARQWVNRALRVNLISVPDLKAARASCTTREMANWPQGIGDVPAEN